MDSPDKKFGAGGGADNTAFVNMEDDQEEEVCLLSSCCQIPFSSSHAFFQLLGEEEEGEDSEKKTGPPIWRFEYYQQFFDVDSGQVMRRIVGSMVPYPSVHMNRQTIRPKPDLYGISSKHVALRSRNFFVVGPRSKFICLERASFRPLRSLSR